MLFVKILNYLLSWQLFQRRKKNVSKKKKKLLKWDCSDDFIADFETDGDITLLKCKIWGKYSAQLRTETQSLNLCGQILDIIVVLVLPTKQMCTTMLKLEVYMIGLRKNL